ncbi:MAG: HDOD domain-containing protein, partial [Chitinivibrionales bacterium]|nr:HDOD domain-containing protein [Chitinivibrionales bacterium]MBD3395981.1 HDOD domain-containing protein [Chitinivibrionales bacterium]
MISLMLTTANQREAQVLDMAFKQRGFEVVLFMPNYQNYVKMLQYLPDILIVEFPKICGEQLHFVKLVRGHKQTKNTPVIGYGDRVAPPVKKGYFQHGINEYLERPLRFADVIGIIDTSLKKISKSLDNLAKPAAVLDREADLASILSPDTLATKKIELMTSHTAKFLAFPFTVAKILKLTQDEKSGAADLAKVIQTDPVISANVLKVSNTVFFASLNRRIASIKDAIVRIGFRETKRIVVSMSVMDLFDKGQKHSGFSREDFWYHSLATAIIAERLAKRLGNVSTEEAFLAGLLHDFGIIMLDEFFGEIFEQVLEKTADRGGLFIATETGILGVNHNDVVKELFSRWKIPETITEGVAGQYDFHTLEGQVDTPAKAMALCVGVANVLAKTICIGRECDQFIRPIDNWIFKQLKMPAGFTQAFLDDVYRDVDLYRRFLGLEERELQRNVDGIDKPEEKRVGYVNLARDLFVPPAAFLAKQGIELVSISPTEKLSAHDAQLDLVITMAAPDSDPDTVDRYCGVVRRGAETGRDNQSPQL